MWVDVLRRCRCVARCFIRTCFSEDRSQVANVSLAGCLSEWTLASPCASTVLVLDQFWNQAATSVCQPGQQRL